MNSFSTAIVIAIVITFVFSVGINAQDDATGVHKYWTEKLRSARSLRVVARSSALGNKRLSILAARSHTYRIEMSDRVVVCNGSRVWNYSIARNSVVVSRFKSNAASMSVETLLLDVVGSYKPVSLKNINSSVDGSGYVLRLEPSREEKYGIRSMEISMDRATKRFRKIDVTLSQGTQSWSIESLNLNVPLPKSAFTFSIPKGCQIVTMDDDN